MRKAKLPGAVVVMKFTSHQRSIGVLTRARALAAGGSAAQDSHLAYLELRSRRLEKPLSPPRAFKPKVTAPRVPSTINANPRIIPLNAGTSDSGREVSCRSKSLEKECSPVVEVSCADSNLEPETRESLIRDSETIRTPDSSTRPTDSIARSKGMQEDPICQYIPSNQETEEFLVRLEKLQQQIFIEKYNFDPVNDCPLPGRYEWVKLD